MIIMKNNPFDRYNSNESLSAGHEEIDVRTLVECAEVINHRVSVERYIPLEDFSDVYPEQKIARDKEKLAMVRSHIKRAEEEFISRIDGQDRKGVLGSQEISRAFEASVIDLATDNRWFGDGTLTRLPEFCDVVEHTDAVLTIPTNENPEHVAVGIDTSRNLNDIDIDRKIVRNLQEVFDATNPTKVTYFASDIANSDGSFFKGKLTDIIPVVIGTDREQCDAVIYNYGKLLQLEKFKREAKTPADKERLMSKIKAHRDEIARTPAQMVFLRAIKMQLAMYDHVVKNFLTAETPQAEHEFYLHKQAQITQLIALFDAIEKEKIDEGFDNDEVDYNQFISMLDAVIKTNLKYVGEK